ncbi:MAG: WYL domain-containing protein [Emticicia sp.]|nr:WYL domain-containing protein [Emticicia sp.]
MAKKTAATSDIRLLRVFEIHKCLRDKPYKTEQLLQKVKLIDVSVNERTIKADIDFLRKLGATIPKGNKHQGFCYKIPFSLLEALEGRKLAETDEIVAFIQQLSDKSPAFLGLDNVLLALEQRIRTTDARRNPFIDFEKVESDGLKRLDEFYRYIKSKKIYEIDYTPFGEATQRRIILPLLLKEYNHRWTLIAYDKTKNSIQNFPLERIATKVILSAETITYEQQFDGENYFKAIIGVTKREVDLTEIIFKVAKNRAFYVKTKKIHHSQEVINDDTHSITFQISVKPNNEMWAKLMELIEDLEIISPPEIREEMKSRISKVWERMA